MGAPISVSGSHSHTVVAVCETRGARGHALDAPVGNSCNACALYDVLLVVGVGFFCSLIFN